MCFLRYFPFGFFMFINAIYGVLVHSNKKLDLEGLNPLIVYQIRREFDYNELGWIFCQEIIGWKVYLVNSHLVDTGAKQSVDKMFVGRPRRIMNLLTHFRPTFSFDTSCKRQKTFGFLTFARVIEREQSAKMG